MDSVQNGHQEDASLFTLLANLDSINTAQPLPAEFDYAALPAWENPEQFGFPEQDFDVEAFFNGGDWSTAILDGTAADSFANAADASAGPVDIMEGINRMEAFVEADMPDGFDYRYVDPRLLMKNVHQADVNEEAGKQQEGDDDDEDEDDKSSGTLTPPPTAAEAPLEEGIINTQGLAATNTINTQLLTPPHAITTQSTSAAGAVITQAQAYSATQTTKVAFRSRPQTGPAPRQMQTRPAHQANFHPYPLTRGPAASGQCRMQNPVMAANHGFMGPQMMRAIRCNIPMSLPMGRQMDQQLEQQMSHPMSPPLTGNQYAGSQEQAVDPDFDVFYKQLRIHLSHEAHLAENPAPGVQQETPAVNINNPAQQNPHRQPRAVKPRPLYRLQQPTPSQTMKTPAQNRDANPTPAIAAAVPITPTAPVDLPFQVHILVSDTASLKLSREAFRELSQQYMVWRYNRLVVGDDQVFPAHFALHRKLLRLEANHPGKMSGASREKKKEFGEIVGDIRSIMLSINWGGSKMIEANSIGLESPEMYESRKAVFRRDRYVFMVYRKRFPEEVAAELEVSHEEFV